MSEWYGPMSVLYGEIQKHIFNETSIVNKCTGMAISVLCNARDSNVYIMPDNEYSSLIDILCTGLVFTLLFYVILYCIVLDNLFDYVVPI